MDDFTVECGLDPYFRRRVAAHLAQSHHMEFGGVLLADAAFFSVPGGAAGLRELRGEAPEENAIRLLAEAFAASGPVRVKLQAFDRGAKFRMSALLERSWARALRETDADEVVQALEQAWKKWDAQERVRGTDEQRAYERGRDAAIREARPLQAEAREREARIREADRRSMILEEA